MDIGSSTIKVYKYSGENLNLILQRTIFFKDGFDPEGGISENNKKELLELLDAVKEENKNSLIKTYATGIFRNLAPKTKINFIDEIFLRTGIYFNIISHELENFYLEKGGDLINGVIRQEFRYVTISGSFRKHLDYILKVKKELENKGVHILSPRFEEPKNPGEEFVIFTGEEGLSPLELERYHLNSIENSDALIVCDPDGYVGASALLEIGYAHSLGKRIIFTEKPQEFILNQLPHEVGL